MNKDCFKRYPVWKWNESRDDYVPVLAVEPLPQDEDTLFIQARFIGVDGDELDGFIVGSDSFYAFGLFIDDETYYLNLNLPEDAVATAKAIAAKLDKETRDVFPLVYSTRFHFVNSAPIKGKFSI